MSGALAEVQMILDLYGETDVFIDEEEFEIEDCPECGEPLDEDGWCANGCLDNLDEEFEDDEEEFFEDEELEDIRAGVDYIEDDTEEEGYVR